MKRLIMVILILSGLSLINKPVYAGETIKLPPPNTEGTMPLEKAIQKRRSIRSFKDQDLSLAQISQLFWAGQGITKPTGGYRAAPSAGATYPLEIYGVSKGGVYHYLPHGHKMEQRTNKDLRKKLALAALGQWFIAEAPFSIVIAAVPGRTEAHYGDKAERYINMEVGHAAENIHLQAVALGLASVPVGAFLETAVKKILDIPKDHQPLYIIPVGYPR